MGFASDTDPHHCSIPVRSQYCSIVIIINDYITAIITTCIINVLFCMNALDVIVNECDIHHVKSVLAQYDRLQPA